MTEGDVTSSSGATANPSGTEQTQEKPTSQSVSYETHQRLLGEKKKLAEKLAQLETTAAAQRTKELQEKEQYKTLYEEAKAQAEARQKALDEKQSMITNGMKLGEFLKALPNGARLEDQYFGLIPLDEIAIDETTGRPDPNSLKIVVDKFKTTFAKVIDQPTGARLPGQAAQQGGTLSYEEWRKLPAKEMQKRFKEVFSAS